LLDIEDSSSWRPTATPLVEQLRPHGLEAAWHATVSQFGLPGCLPSVVSYDSSAITPTSFVTAGVTLTPQVQRSVKKRQADYLFGRLAARLAMDQRQHPYAPLLSGSAGEPLWPPGLTGSISHNGQLAVAVCVADIACAGIGIDVERLVSPDALKAIFQTAVNDAEIEIIRQTPIPERMAATLIFSAKESFYKAAYAEVGRFFDFSVLRVTAIDFENNQLRMEVADSLSLKLDRGYPVLAHYLEISEQTVMTCVHY
jgi:4'-phosphopantetheinyl transferase EntD